MNKKQKKEYNESLEIAKSFNYGFAKGARIFAVIYGTSEVFSKW